MSKLAVFLILALTWFSSLTQISRSNELKKLGQSAYNQKQYAAAAKAWAELLQTQATPDPAVRLNLAHALRLQGKKLQAAREYQQVVRSKNPQLQSVAHLQLGNFLAQAGELDQALNSYIAALKTNAGNQEARFNYELLKKHLEQKNPEEEPQESEDQKEEQSQEQQQSQAQRGGPGNQENRPKPGQGQNQNSINQGTQSGTELGQNNSKSDSTESPNPDLPRQNGQKGQFPGNETSQHRLEQIQMTEERAKALLDAMRRAELQYLQQVPRQQRSRQNPNKPDW